MRFFAAACAAMCATALAPISAPAGAQTITTEEHALRVVKLVERLEHPWGLAFLPDGRMLVTERAGRLRIVGKDFKLDPQPVQGLPAVTAHGQGGLLDVALHPRYSENGLVYISYSARGDGGIGTEVARGKLAGGKLEGIQVIFRQHPKGSSG